MSKRPISARTVIIQGVLLLSLWLVLSGVYDAFHVTVGVGSVLFVLWFNLAVRRIPLAADDHTLEERIRILPLLSYCLWLFWEIVVSSIQVAMIVLRPSLPIDPHLLRFRTRLPNLTARIILGNSITLTPGTVTLEIKNDEFFVHVLTEQAAESLVDGTMPAQVSKIFSGKEREILYGLKHIRSAKDL